MRSHPANPVSCELRAERFGTVVTSDEATDVPLVGLLVLSSGRGTHVRVSAARSRWSASMSERASAHSRLTARASGRAATALATLSNVVIANSVANRTWLGVCNRGEHEPRNSASLGQVPRAALDESSTGYGDQDVGRTAVLVDRWTGGGSHGRRQESIARRCSTEACRRGTSEGR